MDEMPGWITGFDIWTTSNELGAELCDYCGEFYWEEEGHDCNFIPTKSINKTIYVEIDYG